MRFRQTVVLVVTAAAATLAAAVPQPRQRTVPVLVLGRGDAPVPDLGEQDFTVREDGNVREIVRVTPAAPPSHIALLVDDSQAAAGSLVELRSTLNGFASTMADQAPAPAIRVTTFGDRPTVITDFSATFSAVSRGIDRILPRRGAGATFLEALIETSRDLRTRRVRGAAIVAFVAEDGPEFGTIRAQSVTEALRAVEASLWTIALQARNGDRGAFGNDAERERAKVLGDVTNESGGRNAVVLAPQALPQAFSRLAMQLLSRYDVTYGRPESLIPPSRLEVTARDRAWKLQVSRWPAE